MIALCASILLDVLERAGDVGAAPDRLEHEQVADEAQRVAASLARRHDVLDAIGEQHRADAVVVADGRHREHRGELASRARS